MVGLEEGVELNLLGLTFGVDPRSLSIKLPLIGRLGPDGEEQPRMLDQSSTTTAPSSARVLN